MLPKNRSQNMLRAWLEATAGMEKAVSALMMHLLIAALLTIPMAAIACGLESGIIHYYVSKKPHKRQEILNVEGEKALWTFPILGVLGR